MRTMWIGFQEDGDCQDNIIMENIRIRHRESSIVASESEQTMISLLPEPTSQTIQQYLASFQLPQLSPSLLSVLNRPRRIQSVKGHHSARHAPQKREQKEKKDEVELVRRESWGQQVIQQKENKQQSEVITELKFQLNLLAPENYFDIKMQICILLREKGHKDDFEEMLFRKMIMEFKYIRQYCRIFIELNQGALQQHAIKRWNQLKEHAQLQDQLKVHSVLGRLISLNVIARDYMLSTSYSLLQSFLNQYCNETGNEVHLFWIIQILDRCTDEKALRLDQELNQKLIRSVVDCHNTMVNLLRDKDCKKGNESTLVKLLQLFAKQFRLSMRLKSMLCNLLEKKQCSLKTIIDTMESPQLLKNIRSSQEVNDYLNNEFYQERQSCSTMTKEQDQPQFNIEEIYRQNDFSAIKLAILKQLEKNNPHALLRKLLLTFYDGKLAEVQERVDVLVDLLDRQLISCSAVVQILREEWQVLEQEMIDFPGLKKQLRQIVKQIKRCGKGIPECCMLLITE